MVKSTAVKDPDLLPKAIKDQVHPCMVLQEVEVSQIINVLLYLYSVFSSVLQFDLGLLFKSVKINSLLTSPICCACGKWSQKKSEYFNLEMLC